MYITAVNIYLFINIFRDSLYNRLIYKMNYKF